MLKIHDTDRSVLLCAAKARLNKLEKLEKDILKILRKMPEGSLRIILQKPGRMHGKYCVKKNVFMQSPMS